MKEVKAYVRVFMVGNVVRALKHEGYHQVTVIDVSAIIEPLWRDEEVMTAALGMHTHMMKLEIVCSDEGAENVVKTIRANAHTGNKGDGIITISNIEKCVRIRSGELNEEAI